ncbi:hypothetical protein HDV57DRAFT_364676 [Trichoderma longibrachiatum]
MKSELSSWIQVIVLALVASYQDILIQDIATDTYTFIIICDNSADVPHTHQRLCIMVSAQKSRHVSEKRRSRPRGARLGVFRIDQTRRRGCARPRPAQTSDPQANLRGPVLPMCHVYRPGLINGE